MLPREEYRFTVRRPYPPLYFSLFCEGHLDENNYKDLYTQKFSLAHYIELDGGDIYYSSVEVDESARLGFEAMMNVAGLKAVSEELMRREKDFIKAANGSDWLTFKKCYERYTPALMVAWSQEDLIVEKLYRLLKDRLATDEADQLIGKLNIPLQDNFYKQEEYDLVNASNLAEHVKKYEWIKSRYGNYDPYTVEEAGQKLDKIDKDNFLTRWSREKEEIEKAVARAKKILGEDGHVVDVIQFIVYYRTQRTDIINKAIYLFIPALEKIAGDNNLTYEQALHCLADELLGQIPSTDILNERIKGSSVIMDNKVIRCVHGKENQKTVEFFKIDAGKIKEFKGSPACRGIVRGEARIVLGPDDLNKVKNGDVLVTSMTTPNMLTAMNKAVAFVTDEGGITCHAAIISRELNKPCIIGTKVATQVLKDGDEMEVDADRGVVKIIRRDKD